MATLKDIAQRCGVSTATVSYVVNNGPRAVLPETRSRILKAIEEFDYHPNAHARGLKGIKTNTIGVVFPHVVHAPFENAYFGPVLGGIIDVATQHDKATMLFTSWDWDEANASAPRLCDGRCDGFIVVAPQRKTQLVEDLLARKSQVVVVGTHPENCCVDTVDAHNVEGARIAVRHLVDLGHTRIAITAGWLQRTSQTERLEGYKLELSESNIPFDDSLVVFHQDGHDAELVEKLTALLTSPHRPTAIFCAQDGMAETSIEVAQDLGLRVPEDFSVVGFDDIGRAAHLSPALTTIRQPMRDIGFRAAKRLCELMDGKETTPRDIFFEVHLIERASTGPPPSGS